MFRFFLRSLAVLSLTIAAIFGVLDSARSVGASQFVAKPLFDIWSRSAPDMLEGAQNMIERNLGASTWSNFVEPILRQPGWLVFGVLALILYGLSYKRERRFGRFSAR